jgi:hypothetical protein
MPSSFCISFACGWSTRLHAMHCFLSFTDLELKICDSVVVSKMRKGNQMGKDAMPNFFLVANPPATPSGRIA